MNLSRREALLAAALLPVSTRQAAPKRKPMPEITFYVGTYADASAPGIYQFRLNTDTGALTQVGSITGVANPSFLALAPNGHALYAISETGGFNGSPDDGGVYAFAIATDAHVLAPLGNPQPSHGNGPAHVSVTPNGKTVLVANYGGGSIASFPIGDDGSLKSSVSAIKHGAGSGVNASRQDKSYAHSINADPSGRFAVAADLGADKLFVYRIGADGTLTPNNPPFIATKPGAGPRHLSFHKSGKFAYVVNELNNTLTAYAFNNTKGVLTDLQTVTTLPPDFTGSNSTSECLVHPSGKFVYGANRGHNSIAAFAIDQKTGKVTPVSITKTGGRTPRNFGIDPSGRFLIAAHQDSNDMFVFRIDTKTGKLTPTGPRVELPKPVCVRFLPRPM